MRYRCLNDPLFISCLLLYAMNRWIIKPFTSIGFFHFYLNDLICIPFWVPIMLWFSQKAGLRKETGPAKCHEIIVPLIVWSLVFEVLLPRLGPFQRLSVSDPLDITFYAAGAFVAALFWKYWYKEGYRSSPRVENLSREVANSS